MEEHDAILALGALAQETRLRIFRQLIVAGPQGMTPGQLTESLGCSPTALSFHLKELGRAGLVAHQRDGRHLNYRAAIPRMNALLAYLTDHCCQGQPCLAPTRVDCRDC